MKKIMIMVVVCSILLFGCADDSNDAENRKSSFITIEDGNFWRIVYHKKTKVMYTMSTGAHNYGNLTLLVNPDGSPMIYKEGEKEE